MLKGIPQEKRNNAWHVKHTKKKASHKLYRLSKLSMKTSSKEVAYSKAKQIFKKLIEPKQHSFWQRIKLFFNKLFKSNTPLNA